LQNRGNPDVRGITGAAGLLLPPQFKSIVMLSEAKHLCILPAAAEYMSPSLRSG